MFEHIGNIMEISHLPNKYIIKIRIGDGRDAKLVAIVKDTLLDDMGNKIHKGDRILVRVNNGKTCIRLHEYTSKLYMKAL